MGWSTALFMKQLGWQGSVMVVERGGEDFSSTSRSVGGIRHQFSNEENVQMSMFGTSFLKQMAGTDYDCSYVERGYLMLAESEEGERHLQTSNEMQRRLGADVELLSGEEVHQRWPYMQTDHVRRAAFGVTGEGWMDAHLLRASLRSQARALGGVEMVSGVARRALVEGDNCVAVELEDGSQLACDVVVNALGASCADFLSATDPAFKMPVERVKRTVFFFESRNAVPQLPMVVNNDGVYVRPEGSGYLCGGGESDAQTCRPGDFDADDDLFQEVVWPSIAERIPAFEELNLVSSWAGHYE